MWRSARRSSISTAAPWGCSAMHQARTVTILRDAQAPLWFLRCVAPCQPAGWCMRGPEGLHAPHCYLGGSMTEAGAKALVARYGYTMGGQP